MEKVYSIWGITKNGNREIHYHICDGSAKDENEMRTIAENVKNNGFYHNKVRIFPESVGIVIYWQRTFPAMPIIEKKIIV